MEIGFFADIFVAKFKEIDVWEILSSFINFRNPRKDPVFIYNF
jgi:hypothetical protein